MSVFLSVICANSTRIMKCKRADHCSRYFIFPSSILEWIHFLIIGSRFNREHGNQAYEKTAQQSSDDRIHCWEDNQWPPGNDLVNVCATAQAIEHEAWRE